MYLLPVNFHLSSCYTFTFVNIVSYKIIQQFLIYYLSMATVYAQVFFSKLQRCGAHLIVSMVTGKTTVYPILTPICVTR